MVVEMKTNFSLTPDKRAELSEMHHNIFVLSGKVQGGKTTLLSRLTHEFRKERVSLCGFLCEGAFSGGLRSGFTLVNLQNGSRYPLATVVKNEGWNRFRRFYFNPESLKEGERMVLDGLRRNAELVVLDEVGPMELEGKGWSPLLQVLQRNYHTVQLWVVRDSVIEVATERWNIPVENVYSIPGDGEETTMNELKERIVGKINS
jgi:nucleoside-triphosphatase THEP1